MNWRDMAAASATLFFIMDPWIACSRASHGMLLVLLATQMLLNGVADFVGSLGDGAR
jgi:hypothetical protein